MPRHLGQIACNNVSEGVAENSSYNSLFPSASSLKGHCATGDEELLTYRSFQQALTLPAKKWCLKPASL